MATVIPPQSPEHSGDADLQYLERLQSVLDQPGDPRRAKDPITAPLVRIWCEALGDFNPAYQDPEWAAASRFGGLVAPASTLNMWTLPGNRRTHAGGEPLDRINEILFEHGFTSVAAVNNNHRYYRPLRPGDHLEQVQYVGMVSPEKQTSLGRGHFLELVTEIRTVAGEPVGRADLRMLRWNPATGPRAATSDTVQVAAAPAVSVPVAEVRPPRREDTLRAAEVTVGTRLAPWTLPMTQALIATIATATFDFNDVHLDRDAALRRGAPDVYLNILGSSGLVNVFLTDWAGPETILRSVDLRLRAQCHPGDVLEISGEVTAVDGQSVTVDVRGSHTRGDHILATVVLDLP